MPKLIGLYALRAPSRQHIWNLFAAIDAGHGVAVVRRPIGGYAQVDQGASNYGH
jgi:hypothetical protein